MKKTKLYLFLLIKKNREISLSPPEKLFFFQNSPFRFHIKNVYFKHNFRILLLTFKSLSGLVIKLLDYLSEGP